MSKVILHGGYPNTPAQSNKDFFAEISKDLPEGAQILVVYFSREENEYDGNHGKHNCCDRWRISYP